jgi:hypothetical protein
VFSKSLKVQSLGEGEIFAVFLHQGYATRTPTSSRSSAQDWAGARGWVDVEKALLAGFFNRDEIAGA